MAASRWHPIRRRRARTAAGDVEATGDISARDIITGTSLTQITNIYRDGGGKADPETYQAALKEYLSWMKESTRTIFLRGVPAGGPAVDIPLDRIFVPITGKVTSGPHGEPRAEPADAPRRMNQLIRLTLPDLHQLGRRAAIIGDPGSGKSTLLQYIAFSLAEALVNGAEDAPEALGFEDPLPLPILVPLGLYAEHRERFGSSADARQRQLTTFISSYLLERQAALDLPPDFFSALLHQGRSLVLLLDGLDEVRTPAMRAVVAQSVRDLVATRRDIWCLVTSRPHSYDSEASLGGDFCTARIMPLDERDVSTMVHRLFEALPEASITGDRGSAAAALTAEISRARGPVDGAVDGAPGQALNTPLMVRLAVVVRCGGLPISMNRVQLYDSAVTALLSGAYHPDELVNAYLSQQVVDWRTYRRLLQYLAYIIHLRFANASQRFTKDSLISLLKPYALTDGQISGMGPTVLEGFAQVSHERSSILDFHAGRYGFREHALQEFLAGRFLAKRGSEDDSAGNTITFMLDAERSSSSWWREPFLLCIGYLGMTEPDIGMDLLMGLAGLSDRTETMEESTRALATTELAASAMIEFGLAGAGQAERVAARLAGLLGSKNVAAGGVSDTRLRIAAGDALGYLGEQRPGARARSADGTAEYGLYCAVPAGEFTLGSDPVVDGQAFAQEFPLHNATLDHSFLMARFPVTNGQFANFLNADDGYALDANWSTVGLEWRAGNASDRQPSALVNHPVVNVSWFEAQAYCAWLRLRIERAGHLQLWQPDGIVRRRLSLSEVRLPTEVEWERCARGGDGRSYSWGSSVDDAVGVERRVAHSRTTAVGLFVDEDAPYGVHDLCGNVWEWCSDFWASGEDERRVVRGGGFGPNRRALRATCRFGNAPQIGHDDLGFRPVVIVAENAEKTDRSWS